MYKVYTRLERIAGNVLMIQAGDATYRELRADDPGRRRYLPRAGAG